MLFSVQLPCLIAQALFSEKDEQIFNSILAESDKAALANSSLDHILIYVGRQFLGSPYVGGTLDKPESENLVVDLYGMDCVTFLESTIAISIIIKENKCSFEDFCNKLKFIRYRNGIMDGYASRLHYFYDWINNNHQKGILNNITEDIGGKPFIKDINIMTVNSVKYPHLQEDSSMTLIRKVEQQLSSMNKFYIPKEEMPFIAKRIQDGDIIALATTIEGLEVAHVGLAVHFNNELHLMHASSRNKKVEISKLPLSEMLKNKSTYSGIIVSRLKF